jgi:hypothetical protein
MVFIEWWLVKRFTVLIALLIVSCAGWWFVRNGRKSIRVAVIILSSPVAVLAGLFLALQFMALGCLSYSSPVYSPDRSQAVRVRTLGWMEVCRRKGSQMGEQLNAEFEARFTDVFM